ncbi:hypothetical protein M758_2G012800 [Ceratodon purpureus]|nr:hypothetical protein M758_2G012800 [Ceratodon purpureus]
MNPSLAVSVGLSSVHAQKHTLEMSTVSRTRTTSAVTRVLEQAEEARFGRLHWKNYGLGCRYLLQGHSTELIFFGKGGQIKAVVDVETRLGQSFRGIDSVTLSRVSRACGTFPVRSMKFLL